MEDFEDPYIPEESYAGTVICRTRHAVHQNERWSLDPKIYEERGEDRGGSIHHLPRLPEAPRPATGGIVTLSSDFIPEHRQEILNLIRNEDERARNVNPLERVMEIEEDTNEIVVTTTNEKLAQRWVSALSGL